MPSGLRARTGGYLRLSNMSGCPGGHRRKRNRSRRGEVLPRCHWQRRWRISKRKLDYLSAAPMAALLSPQSVSRLSASPPTPPRIANAISEAIKPYSIAVAPDSSRRNLKNTLAPKAGWLQVKINGQNLTHPESHGLHFSDALFQQSPLLRPSARITQMEFGEFCRTLLRTM